jgi:mono/diheme cytochrome c family protein
MDELLKRVAELRGMPASLVERSAQARAEKTGTTLEAVLREWAGEQQDPGASIQEPGSRSQDPGPRSQDPGAESAPVDVTTDHLVQLAADAKRMPPKLILSSATARAEHSDSSLEEVLADWAGVDLGELRSQDPGSGTQEEPTAESRKPVPKEEPKAESRKPKAEVEVIAASPVDVDEAAQESNEVSIVRGGYPRWLAAAFVLIPLLAVTYILVAPNGPDCGTAGQLLIDPVTGETLNCDGTEYGVSAVDYFAQGEGLYSQCVACHAADGSGGAGPAFAGGAVLATFPSGSCSDHIEWVRVGTAGWPDPTYGATDKPVGGAGLMPSFGTMTDEQLASVSLYERVQFGGQPLEEAELDCGVVAPEGDGEGGQSGEAAGS